MTNCSRCGQASPGSSAFWFHSGPLKVQAGGSVNLCPSCAAAFVVFLGECGLVRGRPQRETSAKELEAIARCLTDLARRSGHAAKVATSAAERVRSIRRKASR